VPIRGHEALAHILQDRARARAARGDRDRAVEDARAAVIHGKAYLEVRPEGRVADGLRRSLFPGSVRDSGTTGSAPVTNQP
jgi:hypothetical protein